MDITKASLLNWREAFFAFIHRFSYDLQINVRTKCDNNKQGRIFIGGTLLTDEEYTKKKQFLTRGRKQHGL